MTSAGFQRFLLGFTLCGNAVSLHGQTQFLPLPYFSGPAEANSITRDGSKAIGYSYSGTALYGNAACWWTSAGIVPVPGQTNWYDTSAYGISADGDVIVGEGNSTFGLQYAFYWTSSGQVLQQVPFAGTNTPYASSAQAVSGDGKVIVGTASYQVADSSFHPRAFRWDRTQAAAVLLPHYTPPANTIPANGASGISDDGRRVIGQVRTGLGVSAAARWEDGGSPILFSQGSDTIQAVSANGISPDGSVVVGSAVNTSTGKGVGFKWTAATGVVALSNPTTGFYAIDGATAIKVSGDGRVIVGYGENVAGNQEAIFWVNGQPYRVPDVVILPGSWQPFSAYGVDYFGNTIVGYGRGDSGGFEAYALILDATPPPPPLVAPVLRYSFTPGTGLSVRYSAVPGLRYRMHGGTNIASLSAIGNWTNGIGIDQEFVATPAVTGGASRYFLRLEVSQ